VEWHLVGPECWLGSLPAGDWKPVAVGPAGFRARAGQPSRAGAEVALAALERAASGCLSGEWDGVVTGPVSKEWMHKAGWRHPGQTEFFAERWGGRPVMGFAGRRLRLVLATWHVPLRDVFESLDFSALEAAVGAAARLGASLGLGAGGSPLKIGVCGLNPHAGENGLLGAEEQGRLDPWLDRLRSSHPGLSRCEPADTLFWRALRGEFDVLVALYHDQGLAPLKAVEFESAVNITLGLPWVRTSPDHGTAFSLAASGVPDAGSFRHAAEIAVRFVRSRMEPALRLNTGRRRPAA
jgi:4-hydroxythreonine-4-phosphate dehydrogenase